MEINQVNISNDNIKLTSEDAIKIRNSLTQDQFLILKTIYDEPGIQHKLLAEKLKKSPNNLSNMLKKIKDTEIQLISISVKGTKKHYYLTTIAKQFLEQELFTTKISLEFGESGCFKSAGTIVEETLKKLEVFKKKAGSEWLFTLYNLLSEKNEGVSDEIQAIYKELSDIFCRCKIQSNDALQKVFDSLENEQLVDLIKNHLGKKLSYFYLLEPLINLEKKGGTILFEIIDSVFSELHPLAFPTQTNKIPQELLLSSEEYNNILLGVVKLSSEFIKEHHTKRKAVSYWKSAYFLSENLTFYIAEKCSFLMVLWSQRIIKG